MGSLQDQILAHVRLFGGIANLAEAAREWGTKVETIRSVLQRLRNQKKIFYLLHEHIRIVDPPIQKGPPPAPPPTVPSAPEAKRRRRAKLESAPVDDEAETEEEREAVDAARVRMRRSTQPPVDLPDEDEEDESRPKPPPIGALSDEEETRLLRILTKYAQTNREEKETDDA